MKYLSVFLLLLTALSLGACDWLMQDSDNNTTEEINEVGKADEANEEPPGDGVPDY